MFKSRRLEITISTNRPNDLIRLHAQTEIPEQFILQLFCSPNRHFDLNIVKTVYDWNRIKR